MRSAVVTIALSLAVWYLAIWLGDLPRFILPAPHEVARAMWVHAAILAENAAVTYAEVIGGLALGAAFGTATALNLMISTGARRHLVPVLVFMQAVPVFAIAPLLTLWLGYGFWSKIAVIVLIVYFPLTWAFYDGLNRVPREWLDLAQTMGASEGAILRHLRIPAALPPFGTGLKLAAIYAPVGAVFGEWVGASKGLGYLMYLDNGRGRIDRMFAALIVLSLAAVVLHWLVARLADWLTAYAEGRPQIRGSANSSELPAGSRK